MNINENKKYALNIKRAKNHVKPNKRNQMCLAKFSVV